MPTKYTPRDWQPFGLEIKTKMEALYSQGVVADIMRHAEITDLATIKKYRRRLIKIVTLLSIEIQSEARPKAGEKRAALERAAKYSEQLHTALADLDRDSYRQLCEAAGKHPAEEWRGPLSGTARVEQDKDTIQAIRNYTLSATANIERPAGGRPKQGARHNAILNLARAWKEMTPGKPTRRINPYDLEELGRSQEYGPFGKFVRAVLSPLDVAVTDDALKDAISDYRKESAKKK